jgi:protein gp37
MADKSSIEWTDATWQPITGCTIVSPGCTNCYAMKLAGTRLRHHPSRKGLTKDTNAGPVWNGKVRFNEQWLEQPLSWRAARMVFVCAHGDLFHDEALYGWIVKVFSVMARCERHTFQVLTKRADRMRQLLESSRFIEDVYAAACRADPSLADRWHWPMRNVWLGVSAERQKEAADRIPVLLESPAAVRFVSCEPLLGPLDLTCLQDSRAFARTVNALTGESTGNDDRPHARSGARIDWVIAGGESGYGARPMHPDWARSLRDQCAAAKVKFFFKQWGAWAPACALDDEATERLYDAAPAWDPERSRRCRVSHRVLHQDGTYYTDVAAPRAFAAGTGAMTMFETGKKAAGRLLDGREHSDMPERAA